MDIDCRGDDPARELIVVKHGKDLILKTERQEKSSNVKIECEAAKLKKDRHIGEYIDFGRYVEIRVDKLVRSEVIDEIEMTDVRTFRWAADRT